MSVSIGRLDKKTEKYDELVVSNQRIFKSIWEKAINERHLRLIGCCKILHKKDMKQILWEFEQVKDYVLCNDFSINDKEYIVSRIDEIVDRLDEFWNEIPGIEELDMG